MSIFGLLIFFIGWIYAVVSFGFFLGLGVGWIPAVFIAFIADSILIAFFGVSIFAFRSLRSQVLIVKKNTKMKTLARQSVEEARIGDAIKNAVALVLDHAKKVQQTKRQCEKLGYEHIIQYNSMKNDLLGRAIITKIKFGSRGNPTLAQSTFPNIPNLAPDRLNALREEYENYRVQNEAYYLKTADVLSVDSELKEIFDAIIARCKYDAINYLVKI
jgi:hypothetical protein